MMTSALGTNTHNKPHTHIRMYLKNANGSKIVHESNEITHYQPHITHREFFENLPYVVLQSNTSYRFDKDGATEYYKTTATVEDESIRYRLRIDVFSCYCSPLNENKEPPF